MALDEDDYIKFKDTILTAFKELKATELEYYWRWVFLLPTHSLRMNEENIDYKYEIPIGWNGYGLDDLMRMVDEGYLVLQSETEEDPITLEKIRIFSLKVCE